jgi:hypothetical protein
MNAEEKSFSRFFLLLLLRLGRFGVKAEDLTKRGSAEMVSDEVTRPVA